MQNIILGAANNWAKAILEWNIANNAYLGPHTSGGCTDCQGAITINSTISYTRNLSYYLIGHISKFVQPGAIRIRSTSSSSNVQVTAYENPDGSLVVVAYNSNSSSQSVKIVWNTQTTVFTVPSSSAATFAWIPTASAIPGITVNQITLSPNPGHNVVTLKLPRNGFNYTTIRFITVDGKTALTKTLSNLNIENDIDVSGLSNGIYLIRVDGLNNNLVGRFIKQ
jgi:hypothetical protein